MVYSAELGYDPDEWEECPPPDHFLAFGFFTRILLTIGIIIFGTFFFWLLEAHKEWDKLSEKEKDEKEEQPKIEVKNTPPVVHVPPILDSVEVRTGTRPGEVPKPRKASLTKEENEALLEWERELKRVEEQRLGELEYIIAGGESDQSKSFALPSNAFDNQSQFQELPQLAHRELDRVKAECGATPPSTPPGSLVDTEVLSQEYRKLAKDLERKLLAEIEQLSRQEVLENDARKMSQVLKQHHEDSIRAAVDHLQKESGAPEYVAEQMKKQLEDKIDDTIWQYQNQNQASAQPSLGGITRAEIHTQPQENIWHDNRGDQRDDVEASFTFRPSPPRQLNQEPESQRKPSESPRTIPAVMINDEQMQERMSSSSEDGFIKVYEEDAFEQPQSTGFKRPFQLTSELQNQELISGAGELDDTITADDIEFVSTPDVADIPYVNQETIRKAAIVPEPQPLPPKKELDPREVEQVYQLLQEYEEVPVEIHTESKIPLISELPEKERQISSPTSPKAESGIWSPESNFSPERVLGTDNNLDFDILNYGDEATPPAHTSNLNFQYQTNVQAMGNEPALSFNKLPSDYEIHYTDEKKPSVFEEREIKEKFLISGDLRPEDDTKRLAEADIYIQDAIDYMENQRPPTDQSGGFVMEEDMLESDEKQVPGLFQNASADPTSRLVKTNDVFEKPEGLFDDADDAVTCAPEIQSIEIPPDQMSQNSSNLLDNISEQNDLSPPAAPSPLPPIGTNIIATTKIHGQSPQAPQFWRPTASPDNSISMSSSKKYPIRKQSSLLSVLGVTSMQEMLLAIKNLDGLSEAMRKAGLESTNLIFGIDYTASNKYQGEHSFGGRSLHSVGDPRIENPYQQVMKIMVKTLTPFASMNGIPLFGFGDSKTGDWSVFRLKPDGTECRDLDEVLRFYNEVTPKVELSGPTNFAPLIYQAIEICQKRGDYHILVIIADGQVTNERATRKAIVHACQYPLSIIVVGVGDGPWDMMKVFDESLPKRPWDNFHFVEFHDIIKDVNTTGEGELSFAVQSLLEIPDQYLHIRKLGLVSSRPSSKRSSYAEKSRSEK